MYNAELEELFDQLVPEIGSAETVAGEIVRAICQIGYRCYNDGDHLGVGYGRETCNPAGRYLAKKCNDMIALLIDKIWGVEDDYNYDTGLAVLEDAILKYLDQHPELKETKNEEDMWDFAIMEGVDIDKYESGVEYRQPISSEDAKKWTDILPTDVYNRLCNCRSYKTDIETLTNAKWTAMQYAGKDKEGFTKEDALVAVLEVLDSNGQEFALTTDEYNDFCR